MDIAVDTRSVAMPPWSIDPADKPGAVPAIGDLFVAAALRWPERTAVSDGESSYTYAEMEQGARTVAHWLASQGVNSRDRVVVLTEKRAVMPILAVAIWKCGAVYVPLDATEPAARLRALVARLKPVALINLSARDAPISSDRVLNATQLASLLAGPAAGHVTVAHQPDQAAYIIFASSPSGEPQGVEVDVAALFTYFCNHNQVLRFTSHSRVLSLSPFNVDVSLEDTLLPLSLGGYVFQFRNLPAGAVIRAILGRERITHLVAVSLLLAMITGDGRQLTRAKLPDLHTVMTGAQVCDPALVTIWREQLPQTRFLHAFGPPEATIFSVSREIVTVADSPQAASVIGRPLPGMAVKLVKDGEALSQPGVEGELWIGGQQVMRRYFDRPDETARQVVSLAGTRFFRTGDICSYTVDGDLVFHRHGDEEIVWLAGRRTHLSEVRHAALGCPDVEEVFAGVVRRAGRGVVVLVILSRQRQVMTQVETHLRDVLPGYMRPAVFAWWPTATAESNTPVVGRELIEQAKAAVMHSNLNHFEFLADGTVEPFEEVQPCL